MEIAEVNYEFATELSKKNSSEQIIKFRNLVFKDIVEKGINNALTRENPHVPYAELTNDPINNIPPVTNEQNKLNALEATLKEIKEKRQVIAANALQELINKLTPNGRKALRTELENIQKLIPQGNGDGISEAQINAYQSKKNNADNKHTRASDFPRDAGSASKGAPRSWERRLERDDVSFRRGACRRWF